MDRVSDVCRKCQELSRLTINRSLLSQEEEESSKSGQKSVWKLATTSSDCCCFICPQMQSFNTSLPHAFNGRAQSTCLTDWCRTSLPSSRKQDISGLYWTGWQI